MKKSIVKARVYIITVKCNQNNLYDDLALYSDKNILDKMYIKKLFKRPILKF